MKNKFKIFILLFVIMFCCSGCNGNVTREIRHAGFSLDNVEFQCGALMPANDEDLYYTKTKYLTGDLMITEDGKIYEVSLGQKFSNDQHCREADTKIVVEAIMDNNVVKSSDGKYYYLSESSERKAYSEVLPTDKEYSLYKILFGDATNIKIITVDSNVGSYYVLKNDGMIYNYIITQPDNQSTYKIVKSDVVYSKKDYDSNIVDFNYAGESLSTFIRTENKVYRMRGTNEKEFSKYADVKCKYEMKEDPIFETYKDKILVYNGNTIIATYGKMFSVSS